MQWHSAEQPGGLTLEQQCCTHHVLCRNAARHAAPSSWGGGESLPGRSFSVFSTAALTSTHFSFWATAADVGRSLGWVCSRGQVHPGKRRHRSRHSPTERESAGTPSPEHCRDAAPELESFEFVFLPARRRGGERTGARVILQHWLSRVHGRAGKALGNGTSADPVLAKGCSAAPMVSGPGSGVSNMRPRHGAGERKQRHCGRRRAKRRLGGTWNAGLTTLHCALGGERGETASAGQRAEGRAALLTSVSESSPPR